MPTLNNTTQPPGTISDKDRRIMKRGFYAFLFLAIFGPISWILTTYWDTLPAPPRSHQIQLDGTPSKDPDHISAVLMRADFRLATSKEKLQITRMNFYSSDADPTEVGKFYLQALSTPWYVAGEHESNGRHSIYYREMFQGDSKIIGIEKRFTRTADNQIIVGSGSIIATADVKPQ